MEKVKQITVRAGTEGGLLRSIPGALGKEGVQIRAFHLEGDTARMVVDDPERALSALREARVEGWLGDALAVDLPDEPGAVGALLKKLLEAGVEIVGAYTAPTPGPDRLRLILTVSDLETSLEVGADSPTRESRLRGRGGSATD